MDAVITTLFKKSLESSSVCLHNTLRHLNLLSNSLEGGIHTAFWIALLQQDFDALQKEGLNFWDSNSTAVEDALAEIAKHTERPSIFTQYNSSLNHGAVPLAIQGMMEQTYFLHKLALEPEKVLPSAKSLHSVLSKPREKAATDKPPLHDKVEDFVHKAFWDEVSEISCRATFPLMIKNRPFKRSPILCPQLSYHV
jgi:hypothetical protein